MFSTKLSQKERDQLARWLTRQAPSSPGPKSTEQIRRFLTDSHGVNHNLGGELHEVIVGSDGLPQEVTHQRAKILDCGHAVTSLSEVLGMCDFGHIVCHRHTLYRCSECKRIICPIEAEEKDGKPICPICNSTELLEWLVIAISALLILIGIIFVR